MEKRVLSVPEVTPMPALPDKSLYEHLSQKERMLQGFPYSPFDPAIQEIRARARLLQRQFNNTKDDDNDTRREILRQLLSPACKDNNIYFEPDLRVDHGVHITIGDNFQANYNCVLLDCAKIEIGDNCLFGPNVQLYAATHPLDAAHRQANEDYLETAYPIKIGDNCWLGGMCVINPGVTIGNNVVVGAVGTNYSSYNNIID